VTRKHQEKNGKRLFDVAEGIRRRIKENPEVRVLNRVMRRVLRQKREVQNAGKYP
jgi:hypothetical protein